MGKGITPALSPAKKEEIIVSFWLEWLIHRNDLDPPAPTSIALFVCFLTYLIWKIQRNIYTEIKTNLNPTMWK